MLLLTLLSCGAVAVSLAKPVPGSGSNFGMASPGGNPGAGAASGPVVVSEDGEIVGRFSAKPANSSEATPGPDGIVMRDRALYFVKGGEEKPVVNELRLSEGIVAKPDGEVTLKDGRTIRLEEGQRVTLEGEVVGPVPTEDMPELVD